MEWGGGLGAKHVGAWESGGRVAAYGQDLSAHTADALEAPCMPVVRPCPRGCMCACLPRRTCRSRSGPVGRSGATAAGRMRPARAHAAVGKGRQVPMHCSRRFKFDGEFIARESQAARGMVKHTQELACVGKTREGSSGMHAMPACGHPRVSTMRPPRAAGPRAAAQRRAPAR